MTTSKVSGARRFITSPSRRGFTRATFSCTAGMASPKTGPFATRISSLTTRAPNGSSASPGPAATRETLSSLLAAVDIRRRLIRSISRAWPSSAGPTSSVFISCESRSQSPRSTGRAGSHVSARAPAGSAAGSARNRASMSPTFRRPRRRDVSRSDPSAWRGKSWLGRTARRKALSTSTPREWSEGSKRGSSWWPEMPSRRRGYCSSAGLASSRTASPIRAVSSARTSPSTWGSSRAVSFPRGSTPGAASRRAA